MSDKNCPICNNSLVLRVSKGAIDYSQCVNCGTLFCGDLPQENLVGGSHEVARNEGQNHLRIERVDKMADGIPKEEVRILDFGTGHGYLIKDLKKAGYVHVDGFDAYNEEFQTLPKKDSYHVITCIETIEHTSVPYVEIDVMWRSLIMGGCVMIETGMIQAAIEDGHTLDDWFYIDPVAGHSTIFSIHGLDLLMVQRGFRVRKFFNNYVRLYQKISK